MVGSHVGEGEAEERKGSGGNKVDEDGGLRRE